MVQRVIAICAMLMMSIACVKGNYGDIVEQILVLDGDLIENKQIALNTVAHLYNQAPENSKDEISKIFAEKMYKKEHYKEKEEARQALKAKAKELAKPAAAAAPAAPEGVPEWWQNVAEEVAKKDGQERLNSTAQAIQMLFAESEDQVNDALKKHWPSDQKPVGAQLSQAVATDNKKLKVTAQATSK